MGRGDQKYEMMDHYNNAIGHAVGQRISNRGRSDDREVLYRLASNECHELAEDGELETLSDEWKNGIFWVEPWLLPVAIA